MMKMATFFFCDPTSPGLPFKKHTRQPKKDPPRLACIRTACISARRARPRTTAWRARSTEACWAWLGVERIRTKTSEANRGGPPQGSHVIGG